MKLYNTDGKERAVNVPPSFVDLTLEQWFKLSTMQGDNEVDIITSVLGCTEEEAMALNNNDALFILHQFQIWVGEFEVFKYSKCDSVKEHLKDRRVGLELTYGQGLAIKSKANEYGGLMVGVETINQLTKTKHLNPNGDIDIKTATVKEWINSVLFFLESVSKFLERFKRDFEIPIKNEEVMAGVNRFKVFGEYNGIYRASGGSIFNLDAVTELSWEKVEFFLRYEDEKERYAHDLAIHQKNAAKMNNS